MSGCRNGSWPASLPATTTTQISCSISQLLSNRRRFTAAESSRKGTGGHWSSTGLQGSSSGINERPLCHSAGHPASPLSASRLRIVDPSHLTMRVSPQDRSGRGHESPPLLLPRAPVCLSTSLKRLRHGRLPWPEEPVQCNPYLSSLLLTPLFFFFSAFLRPSSGPVQENAHR